MNPMEAPHETTLPPRVAGTHHLKGFHASYLHTRKSSLL